MSKINHIYKDSMSTHIFYKNTNKFIYFNFKYIISDKM